MKELDKAVAAGKDAKLASFVVFLTDSREKLEPQLKELAAKEKIENVPLTIVESVAGPEKYKIAKDADVTVILYNKGKSEANFAFGKGKLDEKGVKDVVAAIPKIAPAAPPSPPPTAPAPPGEAK